MTKFLRLAFVLLSIFFFVGFDSVAQEPEKLVLDSLDIKKALSIDEISSETETLRNRISGLRKVLKPDNKALEVDSILDSTYVEIMINKDSLYAQMDQLTRRELKNRFVSWTNYKSKLKSLQAILNDRSENITDVNDELVDELDKWNITKEKLSQNNESEDVFASLDTMIITLNDLIDIAHVRLDSVFTIQKRLTELILIVDETNSEISRVERQKQKEYLVFDSDPFWSTTPTDSTQKDSLLAISSPSDSFLIGVKNDAQEFNNFIKHNVKSALIQLIFLLVLFIVMIQMRGRCKTLNLEMTNTIEIQTKKVFSRPLASTIVVGVLASVYFYEALIPVLGAVHVLLILLATVILLPEITTKKFRWFLILLFAAYFIQTIEVYFTPRSLTVRWLLLLESFLLIIGLIWSKRITSKNPEHFEKIRFFFRYVTPFYLVVLVVSVITNLIGMVNLSNMLTYGVILSVSLGMVVFLATKVVTSILVLFFKIRKSNHTKALSVMVDATSQRFQPALIWIGIILWLFFTLKGFDVYDNLAEWVGSSMEIGWRIGDMRISLGSILSFISLFVITLLIAKLLAAIFQDQWMIEVLPRGVAPAISLLLRILIITIGLYLAFSAAGFDLSELGFVFGALGVGIGFGLQNVVLNFIAGLILAFERPINLGDAIEIDNETGVVTSIGVRSSNIRTWSGAEAIIPNGDLISKKVINWTLSTRERRSKISMRTAPNADPNTVIELFNKIASSYDVVFKDPAPKTYFYGYDELGNLNFALLYWTTFDDTLKTDSAIALEIHNALKEAGIQPPMPNQRNFG